MTCRGCGFSVCRKRCRNPLIATPLLQRSVDGSRARRARFPVPDADNASLSLRRDAPSFSRRQQGFLFASEPVYRSHVVRSTGPILSEGQPCCELFERDYRSSADAPMQSALRKSQPSCLVAHLYCSVSNTRLLIGTSLRPSAVLLSGTKITRFCQSKFSIRI